MQTLPKITTKEVVRYMALPGIIPRVKEFVQSGFGGLAYLMAVIYYAVRLLPPGHPYINPANIGRFGIRHVIAQAANNLVIKRENIDQILIFVALLAAFVLLVLQFVFLIGLFLFAPAFAGVDPAAGTSAAFGGLFKTMKPELDIAFMLLDSVFGIPPGPDGNYMFGSCVARGTTCGEGSPPGSGITAFHYGLHDLFKFYNTAILVVAVLIFLYYILIMVAETAQSGTPFGRRFNHIWAPLRLVVALGLLVPLNFGFNSAQYITLFAARMGSGFATNGWLLFNRSLDEKLTSLDGSGLSMVARPSTPHVDHIWQFIAIARTCKTAYDTIGKLQRYDIPEIEPYLTKVGAIGQPAIGTSWEEALKFYNYGDIRIRFGALSDKYESKEGYVRAWCGEITISTKDLGFEGTKGLQQAYYQWILAMWSNATYGRYGRVANCVAGSKEQFAGCLAMNNLENETWKSDRSSVEFTEVNNFITSAWNTMKGEVNNRRLSSGILERGWGAAGLWYNELARWNGALFSTTKSLPTVSTMPSVMQKVENSRRGHDENMNADERYEPFQSSGTKVNYDFTAEEQIARTLSAVYKDLRRNASSRPETQSSGNIFYDMLNMVFGIDGLFELRENKDVHPMASLVAAGKSIIDASIRNLVISLAFAVGGGLTESMESHIGGGLQAVSSMFVSFATMGLTIGFMLYYILPFLPFIYFFFAVGAWVKTIFEAMVGVPLWALAHLRIDGNGLPGDTAMNGYFLIFEIFIRPILTVFGLIASVLIFSAMATTLNSIFDLVTANMTGFDCRGDRTLGIGTGCGDNPHSFKRAVIDEFFFTVIYTIIIYLIGLSCFKLIDQIPSKAIRWMGTGVPTFDSQDGDAPGNLVRYAGLGGNMVSSQVVPALQDGASTVGKAGGAVLSMADDMMSRSVPIRTTGAPGGSTP